MKGKIWLLIPPANLKAGEEQFLQFLIFRFMGDEVLEGAAFDEFAPMGGSGIRARIAWLPMTTNSISSVIPLAARSTCSSS